MSQFLLPFRSNKAIGMQLAVRLSTRLGFGLPSASVAQLAGMTAHAAVNALLDEDGEPGLDEAARPYGGGSTNRIIDAQVWWLNEMIQHPTGVRERVALFWHDHFACTIHKPIPQTAMIVQNEVFRGRGLGPFGELLQDVVHGPALQTMLDGPRNLASGPNENLAREILELFCLGLGNYSRGDVRELARALTGWRYDGLSMRFNAADHDHGRKLILGSSGRHDSREGVAAVLQSPSCARFIASCLAEHLVGSPPPEAELSVLAAELRDDNLHLGRFLRRIALSEAMLGDKTFRTRVPSPAELCASLVRRLGLAVNAEVLAAPMARCGQTLFAPPGVDGWPKDRDWLNSTWALQRAEIPFILLNEAEETSIPEPLRQENPTAWIAERLALDSSTQRDLHRAGERLWQLGHRSTQLAQRLLALPRSQMQ